MSFEQLHNRWQVMEGEQLKTAAELTLHGLSRYALGNRALALALGGERIEDTRLSTVVGGLEFENPLMVGAGWDKKGKAVDGLYTLGFSGTEVGSVLVHPQSGNPRPRLWYRDGVGLNRLGFNSIGMEAVAANLDIQRRQGIVGISIGKNKLTPDEHAPWAHAAVAERLHDYADYFAINVTSPNTPGLRNLLNPESLTNIIRAVKEVLAAKGQKPLFVKTTVDLSLGDLDKVLEVCIAEGVTGIIATNTTVDDYLKSAYGWQGRAGGLSGDSPVYRRRATERMKYITQQTRGTGLQRIGVGAVNDAQSAVERLEAGAQVVQVVTAIRQRKAKVARVINVGIIERLTKDGMANVQELVGIAA